MRSSSVQGTPRRVGETRHGTPLRERSRPSSPRATPRSVSLHRDPSGAERALFADGHSFGRASERAAHGRVTPPGSFSFSATEFVIDSFAVMSGASAANRPAGPVRPPDAEAARRGRGCGLSGSKLRTCLFMLLVMPPFIIAAKHFGNAENLKWFSLFAASHPILSPFVLILIIAGVLAGGVPGITLWVAVGGMVVQPWTLAAFASWAGHVIGAVLNWYTFGGRPPRWRCCNRAGGRRPLTPSPPPSESEDEAAPLQDSRTECLTLVQRCVHGAPWWVLALLRCFPPLFGPVTLALVYFDVPFKRFLWTTALGSLPPQLVVCFYARRLSEWLTAGESMQSITPPSAVDDYFDDAPLRVQGVQGSIWLWAFRQHVLPPRIAPGAVPLLVPIFWLLLTFGGALFGWRGWRLPASRMWRRHPHIHGGKGSGLPGADAAAGGEQIASPEPRTDG
eukprot:TRINITY_DN26011_c1_g1_i1.p1 TRINITY_DN26011_c1_g1~~TRINITY_DN26011_c1_g1_i1.p1  ORF type:complete len:491 (+),score=107.72 TRINITY_DN26011_c1_g1_i1:126-1475(+)